MSNAAPKGYKNQSTDVVGYWDPEQASAIHFIPFGAKMFDSNLDKRKPSILILARLVDDTKLAMKNEGDESEPVQGTVGQIVGIWYKPGMRSVLSHGGHKVWMTEAGEKDIGKPSPMKLYDVLSPDEPKPNSLPLLEDTRDKSRGVETPFDKHTGRAEDGEQL